MEDTKILGTFSWGGPAYYRLRNYILGALALYSYNALWLGGIYPGRLPRYAWIFCLVGILLVAFALLRRKVHEEVMIDHERGQVVKKRNLFGLEQIVPLVDLESVIGVATCGDDFSIRGDNEPHRLGYFVTSKGREVLISVERDSNKSLVNLRQVARQLDIPFHEGKLDERLIVDEKGQVTFSTLPPLLRRFRYVFAYSGILFILGCYAAIGQVVFRPFRGFLGF